MNLQALWPIAGELDARPTLATLDKTPTLGRDFEVVLLAGKSSLSSARLPLPSLGAEAAIRDFLTAPGADFAAFPLPDDRVALVSPCRAGGVGWGIALVPNVGAASVLRVLSHAFSDRVRIFGTGCEREPALRAVDEHTYEYLSNLLSRWRSVLMLPDAPQAVSDRRELSACVLATFRVVEHVLGIEIPAAHLTEFPIPVPFVGSFCPSAAFWMQLLLVLGLRRGFAPSVWDDARYLTEDEMLLPAMDIPVGNRTPLPPEWEECRRLARAKGMFFDLHRHRDHIRVRFCPLTPHIPPEQFYSVRAMAPIIEGIREMKLK